MMAADAPICAKCVFFDEVGDDGVGECHRYPPSVIVQNEDGGMSSRFIELHGAHWCGEWKARSDKSGD